MWPATGNNRSCSPMRVQLKESKVSNLVLPRGAFLKGLVALIAAPAIVKAESLMPISVWRPRLEAWRTRAFCQDWLVVHQFDLDDFHAGRFDVSLLPDWVRKSPCVFTNGQGRRSVLFSFDYCKPFPPDWTNWLERHRPAACGEATRAAETTTDGVISRIIDAGERG
jgi:hypothetical protein